MRFDMLFQGFFDARVFRMIFCKKNPKKLPKSQQMKQKYCLVNSYRNTISKWASVVRYEKILSRGFKNPQNQLLANKTLSTADLRPLGGQDFWPVGPFRNPIPPADLGPLGGKLFIPWAIFGGFFNPWDEEISVPKTWPIQKSLIYDYYNPL